MDDPASTLPFVAETLSALRKEIDGQATLLGFVGTPWTLAAYAMEGKADKHLLKTKTIMYHGEIFTSGSFLVLSRNLDRDVLFRLCKIRCKSIRPLDYHCCSHHARLGLMSFATFSQRLNWMP